jgi:acylphosphatase
VEIHAEGERGQLVKLLEQLQQGPPGAKIEKVEVEWGRYGGSFSRFEVR